MDKKLLVSSSPHIHTNQYITKMMRDVLIALFPALLAGIVFFGYRALVVTLVSVASCVLFESLWNRFMKKEDTIGDLSACVTGVLLAFSMPANVPLWLPVVGALFSIIICKQLFGGLGQNFINPALGGRAFLMASWPVLMTTFVMPFQPMPLFSSVANIDAISSATPLGLMKLQGEMTGYMDLFIGQIGGCIGETSALALLIGAVYLICRRVIKLYAPMAYLGSTMLFGWLMGYDGFMTGDPLFHLLSGGLMLGAFFMITDYTTTPTTNLGSMVAGIIAGFFTILIRVKGGYPEAVTYSIMLVNIITPLIDKWILPRQYGRVKKHA